MAAHRFEIAIFPERTETGELYGLYARHYASSSGGTFQVGARDVQFDLQALLAIEKRPKEYGQLLSETLFAQANIRDSYISAKRLARTMTVPLRVQIRFAAGAEKLHAIHWEALTDPMDGTRMATNQNIYFSRVMNEEEWNRVRLPRKSSIRALIVVSNPNNILKSGLAEINPGREKNRAQEALGNIPSICIGDDEYATLGAVFAALRQGYDILYLICHGAFHDQRPRLWLQGDDGNTRIVSGSEFVTQCKELRNAPRLAILASCESAAGEDVQGDSSPAYLAPSLAEAGIPAVIGMQGKVGADSASRFSTKFFKELQKTGFVDEAVSEARQSIREQPDWWSPSLLMRQSSGRIWSRPGWTSRKSDSDDENDQTIWDELILSIVDQKCTPIIGPEVISGFVGSRRDIASSWADKYRFPMAKKDKNNLPQVAEYLAIHKNEEFLRGQLIRYIYSEAERLYRQGTVSNEIDQLNLKTTPTKVVAENLQKLLTDFAKNARDEDPAEQHNVLAHLNSKIYITTNYGNTLEEALKAHGKDPVVELCRWNKFTSELPSVHEKTKRKYIPEVNTPLVFKVFGQLSMPESMVLTEDDYFDFLIGSTQFRNQMPSSVTGALCETALLFIGYELNDWDFRVLFRSIINQGGWEANTDSTKHVAATLDPEEGEIIEPDEARKYLKDYFSTAKVNIYWGGSDEFLRALYKQLKV